ncbi:MAG: hypothetical protein Q8L20_10830 [Gammaproteobacteria bacterium]|nr:hypothetical protein [Gammaproteobacteria bacterium]
MSDKTDDLIAALHAQTEAITAQTAAINNMCKTNQDLIALLAESIAAEMDGDGIHPSFLDDDDAG